MAQGFYTFLFSDIQGSTRLWEAFPSLMDGVVSRHDELVHGAVRESGGEVYKRTGDGMGAAFSAPVAAVEAALNAQQALLKEDWGAIGPLKVRMGVHSGEADKRDGYFFGSCLNHVARLMSAAHGGQTLVSKTAALGWSEYGFSKSIGRDRMGKQETLETIWEVPDELWERIEPIILEEDPPKARGRKRSDPRQMLNGIIFRLRSGCQWNRLPKELGDDSTIHRTFQRWVGTGVLHRMWGALVEGCEELDGVDWEWQAADGAMGKARFGGT